MDLEGRADLSTEHWSGTGSVNKADEKEIIIYLSKAEEYYIRESGEKVNVHFDPSDNQLQYISFQGSENAALGFWKR